MKITLEVPNKILADVLDGAGSRYWCSNLDWPAFEQAGEGSCWLALLEQSISWVRVTEDGSEDSLPPVQHLLTRRKILKAIQVIAERFPDHLGDVIGGYEHGNADMWTGDVLLQCAVFGDIKYG